MSASDGWRWTQLDYATDRDIHAIEVDSMQLTGFLAFSADGHEWSYFAPDGDRLILLSSKDDARQRAALFPEQCVLRLPESMYVRYIRLWYRHGGSLLGLRVPLDASDLPQWPGVPSFTGAYPPQLATEATMREILTELKKLNGGLIVR